MFGSVTFDIPVFELSNASCIIFIYDGQTRWVAYGRIMWSYTFCSKMNFDLIAYLYDSLFIHTTAWLVHARNSTNHKYYQNLANLW
ncbi:hypothetical protein YC2023_040622 [Brassica napus]